MEAFGDGMRVEHEKAMSRDARCFLVGDVAACPFCGDEATVELLDAWMPRQFMLDTCCEHMEEVALEVLRGSGGDAVRLCRLLGCEEVFGEALQGVVCDVVDGMVLSWKPRVVDVTFKEAARFVGEHHAHNGPPVGWKFGVGLRNGSQLIGVAMVGRPVSRVLQSRGFLEVNRVCVRRDIAAQLVRNACSKLYSEASKGAKRIGCSSLCTYTLESEEGASLRAAGWREDAQSGGGTWSRSTRHRLDKGPLGRKVRWVKDLNPRRHRLESSTVVAPRRRDRPSEWI